MNECPYGDAILHYARERGLQNARLEYSNCFGWSLLGDGKYKGWPLVWSVAEELGAWGGGGVRSQQIKPDRF